MTTTLYPEYPTSSTTLPPNANPFASADMHTLSANGQVVDFRVHGTLHEIRPRGKHLGFVD